jgi:DNA-binding CsgD family transcriptional regulator
MDNINTLPNPHKEIISKEMLEKILSLSDSEYDIFKLMGQGMTTYELAKARGVSTHTVDSQKIAIRTKLNVKGVLRIVAIASRYNLFLAHNPQIILKTIPARRVFQSTVSTTTNQVDK